MTNIIVAFPEAEDARKIKNILTGNGFDVAAAVTFGAAAIKNAHELGTGILVCGCRFKDMVYPEIYECLPDGVRMLLAASPAKWGRAPEEVVCLELPLKVHDLIATLEMMAGSLPESQRVENRRKGERSGEEKATIRRAKELLMDRNHMSEPEAHRYIQKCSMNSGTDMAETARMIMTLY